MKVSEVMTETVISVRPTDCIADAVRLMLENRVSALPVVDEGGQLVGIVSGGDFLRRVETGTTRHRPRWLEVFLSPGRLANEYVHTHGRRVDEVMTPRVVTVTESEPLDTVVRLMEQHRIKRVPVMRNGKIVGIVARTDLMHAVATLQDMHAPSAVADTALRRRILDAIRKEPWAPRRSINVVVRNGRVDLWGSLFDERERQALRVIVENTPGVKELHDHVIWIEPMSGTVIAAPDEAAA